MTNDVYKKIKRHNGERFAQTLRNYHSGLLQIDGLAEMVRHAGRDAEPLLPYLMSLLASNDDKPTAAPILDPFVLLDQAGYDAFHADTLEKQNSIASYFAPGELLCTFNDAARYQNYHIIHAVKKDVDKIRREDFNGKAERQDAYGTSVISIQIKKGGGFISIKNRYNHTVEHCDHTFDSNPDNIIDGLSAALKAHFQVDFEAPKSALPQGYVLMNGQLFKYNFESNNIYYGDQAWAKDGVMHTVDRAAGDALFDRLLFDNKTKTLRNIDPTSNDSFPDDFNRAYGGNKGLTVQDGNLTLNGIALIGAEDSAIITLALPALTMMGDHCLGYAPRLTEAHFLGLTTMGERCLQNAPGLIGFTAPALTTMGEYCFRHDSALRGIDLPALTTMGNGCFQQVTYLTQLAMPSLTTMGKGCFSYAAALAYANLSSLVTMGRECFQNVYALESLDLPALTEMGKGCFETAPTLKVFNAPLLTDWPISLRRSAPPRVLIGVNTPRL